MNINKIRNDFPLLHHKINNKPIIYFDNACMTLKPIQVIEKINQYYSSYSSCGGRSIHSLGTETTYQYEETRRIIQKFIRANSATEILFTKNTTESINLVSNSLPIKEYESVMLTDKEHNSNLIPWQIQNKKRKINIEVVPSKNDNTFDLETFEEIMHKNVKLVSMVHTSNLDGTTIPDKEIIKIAHDYNALVLFDGAQSIANYPIDVQELDVDFFAFSFHKLLGPTGLGVLYGKEHILKELEPYQVGGNTVKSSNYESAIFLDIPEKFEAGLQNYAGVFGANAALSYITTIGIKNISQHVQNLNSYLTKKLLDLPDVEIIGPKDAKKRSGILTFTMNSHDPHEISSILDEINIMVRSGVFCVHSWFNKHKLNGAVRISFYLYNTIDECEICFEKLQEIST